MIQIGIIGGAGYTAGELIRILNRHPEAHIAFVHSNSHSGEPISAVHTDLLGESDLVFTDQLSPEVDVVFLCMGHGASAKFLGEHPEFLTTKIIDLSNDFRLHGSHDFVYGLPELQRAAICKARHVANPGCFATCIQMALLPLAAQGLLNDEIHVNAITGSTGA
ncbi:MAG: N-acetyl-gamma-glutamyl-phosphate reductase, partial [Cytophagales bacterium]|nr:N-acetyl-gamma-glutamyl-phosphate reductase [Cytophagales bacterium]